MIALLLLLVVRPEPTRHTGHPPGQECGKGGVGHCPPPGRGRGRHALAAAHGPQGASPGDRTALWVALVVLAYLSVRAGVGAEAEWREGREGRETATPSLARDLVSLTKPRIISLLLVTTVVPMFITPTGLPQPVAGLWVLAGRVPDGRRCQRGEHVV